MLDPGLDLPGPVQCQGRGQRVAAQQPVADQGRGIDGPFILGLEGKRGDAEPGALAGLGQHGRVAAAILAEAEIVADHHMGDAEAVHQHVRDEDIRRAPDHVGIEGQHEGGIDAEILQVPHLDAERRQAEMRFVGLEEAPRMRLEGQHAELGVQPLGLGLGLGQHRLMAAMHAVEIPDGHHRAFQIGGHILEMAQQSHQFFGRLGTRSCASPSSTICSPTWQVVAKVTRPFSRSIVPTVTRAFTVSPIRTGALNFRVCER
jgi:hypothetical protein